MAIKYFFVAFMLIMSLGAVSAMEWDNVADYKNEDMTVEITNWLGIGEKLGEATLTSHSSVTEVRSVIAGKDRVVMFYEFDFTEGYVGGLGIVTFTDMKKSKSIDRDYSFVTPVYKEESGYVGEEECNIDFVDKINKTICEIVKTPYTRRVIDYWERLEKNDIPSGKITIGLMTTTKEGDLIDGVWEIAGKLVEKHAVWDASLTNGLEAYYKFDEGVGVVAGDSANSSNGTLTGGTTWTGSGKLGTDSVTLRKMEVIVLLYLLM